MSIKETKFFSPSVIGKGNQEGERKGHGVELANGQEKTKSTIDKGPGALGAGDPSTGGTGDYKGSILASLLPALLAMMEDLQKSANIEGQILGQTVTMQALGSQSQAEFLKSSGDAQLFAGVSQGVGGMIAGGFGAVSSCRAMRAASDTSKTAVIDEKIKTLDSFSAEIEQPTESELAEGETSNSNSSNSDPKALIAKIEHVGETEEEIAAKNATQKDGIELRKKGGLSEFANSEEKYGLQSPGEKVGDKAKRKKLKEAVRKARRRPEGDKNQGRSASVKDRRDKAGEALAKHDEVVQNRDVNQKAAVKSYNDLKTPEERASVKKAVKERKESLKAERAAIQEENRIKAQTYNNNAQNYSQVAIGMGSAGSGVANQQHANMQAEGAIAETVAEGMKAATSQASTESQNLHRAAEETQDVIKSVSASQKGGG